jgi:hypothetical protein
MATPYATVQDVAIRLNTTFEGGEEEQVEAFLRDVSALIRNEVPDLDTRLADGQVDPDFVVGVVFQIIGRILTAANGGGVGVTSETHPEYAYTLSRAAAEGLELTAAELRKLRGRRSAAFSIIPG